MALICIPSSTTLSLFPLILLLTLLLHFHQCSGLKIRAFKYFYANSSCFVFTLSSPIGMHYHSVFTPPFIHKAGRSGESETWFSALHLAFNAAQAVCCSALLSLANRISAHFTTRHSFRGDKYDRYDFLPFICLPPSLFRLPVHSMSEQNERWCLESGFLLFTERLQLHASKIRI